MTCKETPCSLSIIMHLNFHAERDSQKSLHWWNILSHVQCIWPSCHQGVKATSTCCYKNSTLLIIKRVLNNSSKSIKNLHCLPSGTKSRGALNNTSGFCSAGNNLLHRGQSHCPFASTKRIGWDPWCIALIWGESKSS